MSTALDFRDIHQHPPSAVKAGQPLPADPSWDAHKVYFNEREREFEKKGDDFDDFFEKKTDEDGAVVTALVPPPAEESKENATAAANDETLDPLGWPVDAFRTLGTRVQSILVPVVNDDDDGDDNDEDDLNLLRKSDEEPSTAATVLSSLGVADAKTAQQMVDGVQNLFLYGSTATPPKTTENGEVILDKEDRIKMYETTGVDDESSVEEEEDNAEDEADWGKDDVGYVAAQGGSMDEGDNLLLDNVTTSATTSASTEKKKEDGTVPDFQPVAETAVPTFKVPPPNPKKTKKKSKEVPMIRPPPAEKLAKWEAKQQQQAKK